MNVVQFEGETVDTAIREEPFCRTLEACLLRDFYREEGFLPAKDDDLPDVTAEEACLVRQALDDRQFDEALMLYQWYQLMH